MPMVGGKKYSYDTNPKGKGKFTKYDDPKKREATMMDILQEKRTKQERNREDRRNRDGSLTIKRAALKKAMTDRKKD